MSIDTIAESLVFTTTTGAVRGFVDNGVATFLGIPYAAAPVGLRRFQLPEPYPAWSGVRDGTEPGPNAPQIHRQFKGLDVTTLVRPGWQRGDDFLSLNVWAPPEGRKHPVMVWIHGGAFTVGDKDAPVSNGSEFARSGVVCFAINYRLGIEGFLPIPGIPTNLGLRDQLFALEWVRRNAEAFGGDPENVTVFGESAGAMSIANLITSPLARGLFRRAIVESGHGTMVRSIPVMRRVVEKTAKILNIPPTEEGFRSRSIDEALAAVDKVQRPFVRLDLREADGREPSFGLSKFLPVYGDDVLPLHPLDALAHGAGKDIDVLIGTNREEMNLYFVPTKIKRIVGRFLARFIVGRSEPNARVILDAYGLRDRSKKPADAFTDAMTDLVFRLPARRYAAAHQGPTHVYEFAWRSSACAGQLGACHGVELPFVFKTTDACAKPNGLTGPNPPGDLAERVHAVWVAFAKDGTAPWPEYDTKTRQVFDLVSGTSKAEAEFPAAPFIP